MPDDAEFSKAIEELLRRFGALIRSVVGRFGMSKADADELIQDVRIRLWKVSADGAHEEIAAGYFKKVVMSVAVDMVRRRRRERTESIDEPPKPDSGMGHASIRESELRMPDRVIEHSELGDRIGRAVAELGEPRDVVVRLYLAGYDRFEIAELMGWTEAKTRNLLYRGLDALRKSLRKAGVEPLGVS